MRRLMVPVVLVLIVGLGSYAIFAQQQQPPNQPQRGMGGGMMGGGMMERGMMPQGAGGMGCPACAAACGSMMRQSLAATSDGGVVMATAGKLVKYDSSLEKISETNIEVDWTAMHQRMQRMMQNCPMMQQAMRGGQTAQPAPQAGAQADHEAHHPSQP